MADNDTATSTGRIDLARMLVRLAAEAFDLASPAEVHTRQNAALYTGLIERFSLFAHQLGRRPEQLLKWMADQQAALAPKDRYRVDRSLGILIELTRFIFNDVREGSDYLIASTLAAFLHPDQPGSDFVQRFTAQIDAGEI